MCWRPGVLELTWNRTASLSNVAFSEASSSADDRSSTPLMACHTTQHDARQPINTHTSVPTHTECGPRLQRAAPPMPAGGGEGAGATFISFDLTPSTSDPICSPICCRIFSCPTYWLWISLRKSRSVWLSRSISAAQPSYRTCHRLTQL